MGKSVFKKKIQDVLFQEKKKFMVVTVTQMITCWIPGQPLHAGVHPHHHKDNHFHDPSLFPHQTKGHRDTTTLFIVLKCWKYILAQI